MSNTTSSGPQAARLTRESVVRALLWCGVVSLLVYAATDVLAALRWEGYRLVDRAVSELLAVGSPTRSFVVAPMLAYNALVTAFGVGVYLAAGAKRSLRIAGVLLGVYGVASVLGLLVFPLRPDSALTETGQMPLSGVMHSVITFVLVMMMFAFIGFGAAGLGRGFRVYSAVTAVLILGGGIAAGMQVDRIASGTVVPWFGVLERTNIYASLLWVAVFAIALLRALPAEDARTAEAIGAAAGRKKNVVVLLGSPHKGGATYTASRKLLDRLESFGDVAGEIVAIGDYDIGVCRGCKVCFALGEERCPLRDDRDVLIGKMRDADAVVFASPNYSWNVSSVMKVFLDRIGYAFHRPSFHGKVATSIVVQGMFRGNKIREYLDFVAGGLGFRVVKGSVHRTLEPMSDSAKRKMDETLDRQASRLHDELMKPAFPVPSLFELALFRMARTGVAASAPRDKRDYAYYGEKGWFDSDYYYPVRLGVLKRGAGAVFDWIAEHTRMFEVAEEPSATVTGGSAARSS